jgi:hypothetical protein
MTKKEKENAEQAIDALLNERLNRTHMSRFHTSKAQRNDALREIAIMLWLRAENLKEYKAMYEGLCK